MIKAHRYYDVLFSVELITNPKLRAEHMNRVEVLDRVGGLLLLPNTELATTKQVAEFYGVSMPAMYSLIHDNREELESNGMKNMSYVELKELIFNPSSKEGLKNQPEIQLSRRGSTVFNARTILLVGFMLRDSSVAQEVRNQVLNIVESASDEHKTFEITQEKQLLMAIMFAENEVARATAINTHLEYVNRHKKQMEETIEINRADQLCTRSVLDVSESRLTELFVSPCMRGFRIKVMSRACYIAQVYSCGAVT